MTVMHDFVTFRTKGVATWALQLTSQAPKKTEMDPGW